MKLAGGRHRSRFRGQNSRTTKTSLHQLPPATPRRAEGRRDTETSSGGTASGQKSQTQSASRVSAPISLAASWSVGAPLAYLLCLRAALRGRGWQPIAPPRCRPLLYGAGRVRGQRGTLPGAQGTPRPPRLPRRLPSASPCAPFQASSTCPGNNQFLIQIKETVL